MGTTSDKLTYLNTTKGKIKDVINMTGANIISDTTFRNYATKLYDGYISVLKDKNTLLDNMPKGTSTGTINDAANLPVYEDKMSKESTQDGEPTPENPVEVKTVKGYRNLFDKTDTSKILNGFISKNNNIFNSPRNDWRSLYISCKSNTNYVIIKKSGYVLRIASTTVVPDSNVNLTAYFRGNDSASVAKITTNENANYLIVSYYNTDNDTLTEQEILDSIMIIEGTEELPYVPYGTNWIYTAVSNGTDTNYYTIPLNDNEIVGKGINLDELIIDKHGYCFINKKFAKIDSYNGETITTDYWSTTGGLDIGATIYYVLSEPQPIDLNYTVDMTLFKGINSISNSENMDMEIKYIKEAYE